MALTLWNQLNLVITTIIKLTILCIVICELLVHRGSHLIIIIPMDRRLHEISERSKECDQSCQVEEPGLESNSSEFQTTSLVDASPFHDMLFTPIT